MMVCHFTWLFKYLKNPIFLYNKSCTHSERFSFWKRLCQQGTLLNPVECHSWNSISQHWSCCLYCRWNLLQASSHSAVNAPKICPEAIQKLGNIIQNWGLGHVQGSLWSPLGPPLAPERWKYPNKWVRGPLSGARPRPQIWGNWADVVQMRPKTVFKTWCLKVVLKSV